MKQNVPARNGVLVVDDEPDIRMLFRFILEKHGFTVHEAEDGKKALEILDNDGGTSIFCVITDYLMPRVNGLQLCNHLRQGEKYEFISCIFLITAYMDDDRLSDISCFNGKYSKPVDYDALVTEVASFCGA